MNLHGMWINCFPCSVKDCHEESIVGEIDNNIVYSFCKKHCYLYKKIDYNIIGVTFSLDKIKKREGL